MKIILPMLLLLSASTYADNKSLLTEFMEQNYEVLKAKTDITLSKYDTKNVIDQKFWMLGVSGSYGDNSLDETTGTGATKAKSISKAISLTKDFNWGGHLNLSATDASIEPNDGNLVVNDDLYLHSQSISYTQDLGSNLFGRNDRMDIAIANQAEGLTKSSSELKTSVELLTFYSSLLQACLNKTMVSLAKEAHKRAVSNTSLIKKRVRDGLREKVDLYQAQMTEKNQWEQVIAAKKALEESRSALSIKLHREVAKGEIELLNLKSPEYLSLPDVKWENNLERKLLIEQESFNKLALSKIDNSFIPAISLVGSYQTNDYAESSSKAFSDGSLGGDQRELTAALNLSWSIGNSVQKNNEAKQQAQLMLNASELRKKEHSHKDAVQSLYRQVEFVDQSLKSVQDRIVLARKVLKEFEKLYNQGRAGIDRLLDAESRLIATENNYANYIFARKLLVGNLYFLNGSLGGVLLK